MQSKVPVETLQPHPQLLLLIAPLPVSVCGQPFMDFIQKLPAAFLARNSHQGKPPLPIDATNVLESQKIKCLWFLAVVCFSLPRKSSKQQDARLLRSQLKPKSLQSQLQP